MKESYRGHELEVIREESAGGEELVFWAIMRELDHFECASGYSDDEDTLHTWMQTLRTRVDNELSEPVPWGGYDLSGQCAAEDCEECVETWCCCPCHDGE